MEFDKFQDTRDPKEFFNELVRKALEGKQSNFEFIRSYSMLQAARAYRSGTRKVAKIFNSLRKGLLKEYAGMIMNNEQKLDVVMTIIQFEKCRDYYLAERDVAKDMISEYKTYVMSGHILDTILGGIRPEEDCVDFRKLPIKFF